MRFFNRLSIQNKLMLSMALCMVLFLAISSGVSVTLITRDIQKRVVEQELPAQLGQIRNDILRRIAKPLAMAEAMAANIYLQDWESGGLSDDGLANWKRYASRIKQDNHAASAMWASEATGKYFDQNGLNRTLSRSAPGDQWFYGFLASGKPYTLNIDEDNDLKSFMLFVDARADAGNGKLAVTGLGLPVDGLAETIRNYKIGKSGYVFLVRDNGSIMMHPDTALVDGKHYLKDLPGFDEQLSRTLLDKAQFTHAVYGAPDGNRIVASSYVPELNLYVVMEEPEAEVLAGAKRSTAIAALVAGLVGGGIGLLIIFLVSRAISAPVARAARMLGEIADGNGDLTRRMPVESGDEVGALAEAFNRFVSSLNRIIGDVRGSTNTIAVATREIASGNLDLSSRTETQASSLEETASAMEQLTSTVRQNADNARQANALVTVASELARKGGGVVGEVVSTMGEISAASGRISEIIGVIDGIAFQTNLLALNAAVEAARAGEHGRGFAVVASEVRNLAQRSASAAREIKTLIGDSVAKVEAGSQLVDSAGATMQEIVASVGKVVELVRDISAASEEQSDGIAQVNVAITQMDSSTQQNAALVEQAAAAAQSLQEQAAALANVVSVFRLEGDGALSAEHHPRLQDRSRSPEHPVAALR